MPKEKRHTAIASVSLEPSLKAAATKRAKSQSRSLSNYVVLLIERDLNSEPAEIKSRIPDKPKAAARH